MNIFSALQTDVPVISCFKILISVPSQTLTLEFNPFMKYLIFLIQAIYRAVLCWLFLNNSRGFENDIISYNLGLQPPPNF